MDAGAGAADFLCCSSQASNAAGFITIAWLRMSEWPRPQSSLQMSGNVPSRSGVMWTVVTRPGTMSSFVRNSGTKKAWMTSSERMSSSTERPSGSRRTGLVASCASG